MKQSHRMAGCREEGRGGARAAIPTTIHNATETRTSTAPQLTRFDVNIQWMASRLHVDHEPTSPDGMRRMGLLGRVVAKAPPEHVRDRKDRKQEVKNPRWTSG